MAIKLKKQVIEILKILKEKKEKVIAEDLAQELNIDYIVLMSAVNDLIEYNLGGFEEKEINRISLNEEGQGYLENGLPERQLLQLLLKNEIKEISIEDFLKRSKLNKNIFYIGLSNMKKNRWIAQSKATGDSRIYLITEDYSETKLEKLLNMFKGNNDLIL